MLIVGLTGSIGMGKSTAAERFIQRGIAVFDADSVVHALYRGPLAVAIDRVFPGTLIAGQVDRAKLSAALLSEPNKFKALEAIVHPAVRAAERDFVRAQAAARAKLAVLEIPLLFEAGGFEHVDVIIVVSAGAALQRARVLGRRGMSPEKLDRLLLRQLSDEEKRSRADFVVDTSGSVEACHTQIDVIIKELESRTGPAFERFWQ